MSALGTSRVSGSVFRWDTGHAGVELLVRGGAVYLHAADSDGELVLIELPPEVVAGLATHLAALATGGER